MGDFQEPLGPPRSRGSLGTCWACSADRTCRAWRTAEAGITSIALCPPPDLEALEALQGPETNRSRPS
jgi:hypothetical protein